MGRDCILDWWRCISEKRKVFREVSQREMGQTEKGLGT